MRPRRVGMVLAVVGTLIVVGFGLRAVRQFSSRPSRLQQSPIQTPPRVIEDPYAPDFVPTSEEDRRALREGLEASAYRALREITPSHRPSDAAAREIAAVFAEFVTVCRTGTPEDHAAMVQSRGREPDKRFLDPEHKDGFWKTNTGWAREAAPGIDGIWARPRSIRGAEIPVDPSRIRDGGGTVRHLADRKFPFTDAHDRTIYEVIFPTTLAAVDGALEEGAVGILIANDAPNGGWDTLGTFSLGVPQGFIIFMTPP